MKFALKNIFALLVVLLCLVFTSFNTVSAQAGEPAEVGIFENIDVSPGTRFEVPVSIRGVEELYAADLTLRFDPEIIQIEDANPDQEGVQLALGPFLDAGLVLFNSADNDSGTIRFTMTQVNPSEPKSGEGILLVLYVQALEEGESQIEVEMLELASRAGDAIPAEGVASAVVVSDDAVAEESTPIPVQDPTTMIQVPSPQPTGTPTATPTLVPEPTPTPESTAAANAEEQSAASLTAEDEGAVSADAELEQQGDESDADLKESSTDQQTGGFSLLRYWWAVAIFSAIVIGLAIFLVATRK